MNKIRKAFRISDAGKQLNAICKNIKKVKPKDWNNIPIPVSELLTMIATFIKYDYKTQEITDEAIETISELIDGMEEYINNFNDEFEKAVTDRFQ